MKQRIVDILVMIGIILGLVIITVVDYLPIVVLLYLCLLFWGFYIAMRVYDWKRDRESERRNDGNSI